MTIKQKAFIIGSSTLISVIAVTIIIFYFSYFGYIDKDKEQHIIKDFEVINHILKKEEDNLQSLLMDWGQWDDTYEFINKPNQEYIDSNLSYVTIDDLNLENVIYINNDKKIVYSEEIGMQKEDSQAILEKLLLNSQNFDKANNQRIGLLFLKGKVYIVGTLPITSSDKQAESNGTIILTREIDKELLNYIDEIIPVNLKFRETQQQKFENNDDISYINSDDGIITYSKENSEASKTIEDINGQDSIIIRMFDKNSNSEQISHFLKNFIFRFLCLIVIILIFDIIVINRYILIRLSKLTSFIEKVGKTKDTKLTVNLSGNDEFSKLAEATNKMLAKINLANQEILFLSYSDKLTGLKNRAYMEKILNELDKNEEESYYIIMGDLNGLKLTNDALSHVEGDKLLKIVSRILKENCAYDDVISRWGGDEFIILIKNKDEVYVSNLIDKIRGKCENEEKFHFKISIALGYAGSYEENSNIEAVMGLAEKRMYRNKLLEEKSARSATINSLLRTLHEKNSETEEHTIRIKNLSLRLGKRIGLKKEKLDELELLSSLHDIGKIGIPEQILMKSSKLTDEEWETMKTHSDIGYRIASSTPELAHIANKILAHHERYDGTGYPNKLNGEEIPLLSRIITIVDSFDVMTHKRIYKEAFDKEYVIEELERCSGTQFDPLLVKEFIDLLKEENIY
ncbi:diguanylate cyclase [Clostridium beijerinckii]|nr:diguanylate cyclase [Clostridium beijerinckii]